MTIRDVEYVTREDDSDLNEMLEIMHNQMIFEGCSFSLCRKKEFRNCYFINCEFENVANSHFTNCTFDTPKFYYGFNGTFTDCSLNKYSGKIGELKEKDKK